LIWCNLNSESDAAVSLIKGAVEIRGSMNAPTKSPRMLAFSAARFACWSQSPPSAAGAMNWQHCPNVAFLGLSDSYEQFYQAVRRCWRFGQEKPVHCYIVTSSNEGAVTENIKRKEKDAARMAEEMVNNMHELNQKEVHGTDVRKRVEYKTKTEKGTGWEMRLGDCVEQMREIKSNSLHYSIFSPPFASLYTYSASERDMGNCRTHSEFFHHFNFLVLELHRALMPGRLVSFSLHESAHIERARRRNRHFGLPRRIDPYFPRRRLHLPF